MYRAINNWVVVKRDIGEKQTSSGIITVATDEKQVFEFEVVSTTEQTQGLQDKTICAQRHKVMEIDRDEKYVYGSIKLEDIIAIR